MALLQTLESLVNVDRFSNPSSTSTLNSESTHRLRAHVPLSSSVSSRPAFPITAHDDVEHKKLARLPPGFRYQPKLSELAYHFLPKVLEGCSNIAAPVCHVDDVFNYHPVQLSGMSRSLCEIDWYAPSQCCSRSTHGLLMHNDCVGAFVKKISRSGVNSCGLVG